MNGTKTQDELIRDLPPEISNLLFNTDMDFYLLNLLSSYGVDDNAKMLVVLSTRALLTGNIAPTEFVKLVSDVTGLDQAKASLIAQDINRDIFNPVKDALKLVHASKSAPTEAAASIPTPYQMPTSQPAPMQATTPVPPTAPSEQALPRPPVAIPTPPAAVQMPTPNMSIPPRMPAPAAAPSPSVVVPQTPVPPVVNNLEAKLGGAFTIKKDVMFTQPGTPAPITPIPSAVAAPTPVQVPMPPAPQAAPMIPQPQDASDPYRELPS